MERVIQQQSFKPYTLVGLFAILISTVLLPGFACAKKPSVSAPSPDSHVPKEKPREGVVEPTQSPKQSPDTTGVTRPAPSKQPNDSIDISYVKRIEGTAWQGKYLWVLDSERKKIYKFDPTIDKPNPALKNPKPVSSIKLVKAADFALKKFKGLTFDGKALWTTDEGEKKLIKIEIDPIDGKMLKMETIAMKIPKDKGVESIEGIAWDKKRESLWVAIYAGFSSSFNQIDPKTGQITKSIFSDSYPKGIATDGEYFWSICYNGEEFPSAIDQRIIQPEEHKMLRSREFIKDIPETEPISLVFDGNDLWYADRKTERVIRFTQPKKEPLQSK